MSARPRLRRPLVAVALVATAGLALTGCASGAAVAAHDAAPTRTVDTLYGEVTVPATVKRVVAFGFPEDTALADLGITPVGRDSYIPDLPLYDKLLKPVPVVTDESGLPDLEKIAALKPDLIVGDVPKADKEKYRSVVEKLAKIAPTAAFEWKPAAGNWPAEAAGVAEAVGRTKQLAALKAEFEKKAAAIKQTYADVLAANTVDLVSGTEGTWYLYDATSSHGAVLAAAGARFGAAATQTVGFQQYSTEKYGVLRDTGILVVENAGGDDAAGVTSNPVFAGLPAAQAGHVIETRYYFPSSYRIADALLDDVAAGLKRIAE
jgi:iron complex transport system substrate-binding protein